jgi:general secretion pathway protein G
MMRLRSIVKILKRRRRSRAVRQMSDNQLGMTLIEIMVVVAIIGLLMGTVGVVAYNRFKKAQKVNTKQIITNVQNAVQTYHLDNNGECPKDLRELYTQKILNKEPKDAWGQPLIFKCPGEHNKDGIDVLSKGPDKREGTPDDIKNWSEGSE